MGKLLLASAFLVAAPAWALEGPAPAIPTPAAVSASTAPAAGVPGSFRPGTGKSVHLGKIEVPGMKAMVETLREIKVAVKRPFDNDPAHIDEMVCRLGGNVLDSHVTRTLECGTEGWFTMQRNQYQFGNEGDAAVATLGHPWHSVRALNPHQMMVLRELLRHLPPPGQGDVQVIEDQPAPLEPSH